jgi:hypothetical protein
MEHDSVFCFRLGAAIGTLLNLFGLTFTHFPPLLQIHTFSEWITALGLKLFELALAGLVTGFCGIAGKKLHERWFGKKLIVDGEKEK